MTRLPNIVTIETLELLKFLDTMFRQDDGVDEATYLRLGATLAGITPSLWLEVSRRIDATDGRFYLPIESESLNEILS